VPVAPSPAEVAELLELAQQREAAAARLGARWGRSGAILPWTTLALDLIKTHKLNPVRASRALALLHVAAYDAVAAAWDAQETFRRPEPALVEPALAPAAERHSSFPSEHAAVAAAAELVLGYLFPDEPPLLFAGLAREAATSGLWAGTNFRSDIEPGLEIGRAVGTRAVSWGANDGSDVPWDGSGHPAGEGHWQPTPPALIQQPVDPLAGTWRPWVLGSGDELRPAPPPAYGSAAWRTELAAVREAVAGRTIEQEQAIRFWAGGPGTVTPAGLWIDIARTLIVRDGLDAPAAAQVLALTSVAMADAFICCWDAKYAYWTARPITADPTLDVLLPTPPFPSYTSGHSTVSAAAATVLSHLFPQDGAALAAHAEDAKNSRLWAGIHFPVDNEIGARGGGIIGRLVVARAVGD
jgi:membrane-associated phospholipid phosphatase